jgi:hypothetical protein
MWSWFLQEQHGIISQKTVFFKIYDFYCYALPKNCFEVPLLFIISGTGDDMTVVVAR